MEVSALLFCHRWSEARWRLMLGRAAQAGRPEGELDQGIVLSSRIRALISK